MDWVGPVAGSIVGLAGIGAVVWSSVRDRHAQYHRALVDEKRQAYIGLFTCGDQVVAAVGRVRYLHTKAYGLHGRRNLDEAILEMSRLRLAFNSAVYQLSLVAPPDILDTANDLRDTLRIRAKQAESGNKGPELSVRYIRGKLLNQMRTDLGHPILDDDQSAIFAGANRDDRSSKESPVKNNRTGRLVAASAGLAAVITILVALIRRRRN
jgi:hypothetical protein